MKFFVFGCSRRQYLKDSLQHWLVCVSCLSCLSQHYDKYVIKSGNSGCFSWITWVNCSFRMKAIRPTPKLGSYTWHNIIYTSQNNFKSSSTTRNWWKLQHAAILSCWRHFCMLRLSKNSYLDDSAHKHLMIPHTNFGEWSLGGNDTIPTHYYWPI